MSKKFPAYVSFQKGCTLRLKNGNKYYRDAGEWELAACYDSDGVLRVSECVGEHLIGQSLVEVTEEEWREDNKGYV